MVMATTKAATLDLDICALCGLDTALGSGNFVNRSPYSCSVDVPGRGRITVWAYMCAECEACDRCVNCDEWADNCKCGKKSDIFECAQCRGEAPSFTIDDYVKEYLSLHPTL
jgi:hypothetical protein